MINVGWLFIISIKAGSVVATHGILIQLHYRRLIEMASQIVVDDQLLFNIPQGIQHSVCISTLNLEEKNDLGLIFNP